MSLTANLLLFLSVLMIYFALDNWYRIRLWRRKRKLDRMLKELDKQKQEAKAMEECLNGTCPKRK